MLVIGLTGGIGSGKSAAAQRFEVLGVPVIDMDVIARQLVEVGQPALEEIVDIFGYEVLDENSELDRKTLRDRVFDNPERRKQLEDILHPRIRQATRESLQQIDAPYAVVVIPLLFETGQSDWVDRVLVVDTSEEEQIRRTSLRDGVTEADVEAIMKAQVAREERLSRADDIIENFSDLDALYRQVDDIHRRYSDMANISVREIPIEPEQEIEIPETPVEVPVAAVEPSAPHQDAETSMLTYTLPLNERVRTLLRLESLFAETEYHLKGDNIWDTRAAMQGLINIMTIFSRPELKTEFMKELERINAGLVKYSAMEGVDSTRLEAVVTRLKGYVKDMRNMDGQIALKLKFNEFLSAIKQKDSMPGGAMCFDTPGYAWWLGQSADIRKQDLREWLDEFSLVKSIVSIILQLIQCSTEPTDEIARKGFFQSSLDTGTPYQMLQVRIPHDCGVYPEISGGKHRFTVRFLQPRGGERPVQTDQDVEFKLICSAI
jgi:cell division protein ZapD